MRKQKSHARRMAAFVLPLILLASWFALPSRYHCALEPTAYAAATTFTVNVTGDSKDTNPGDGIVDGDDASPRSAAGDPNQSN